jgi:hypothetical protein
MREVLLLRRTQLTGGRGGQQIKVWITLMLNMLYPPVYPVALDLTL